MLVRYARDYHFEPPSALVAAGMSSAYRGHDGLRKAASDLLEAWERMEYTPIEIVDAGDPIVVLGHLQLRGGRSGVELDSRIGGVYWVKRGLIARERQFTDWDDALRSAGIPGDTGWE